jgi:hypothetical protein
LRAWEEGEKRRCRLDRKSDAAGARSLVLIRRGERMQSKTFGTPDQNSNNAGFEEETIQYASPRKRTIGQEEMIL